MNQINNQTYNLKEGQYVYCYNDEQNSIFTIEDIKNTLFNSCTFIGVENNELPFFKLKTLEDWNTNLRANFLFCTFVNGYSSVEIDNVKINLI